MHACKMLNMFQVNPEMTRSATGLYKQNNVNVVGFHNVFKMFWMKVIFMLNIIVQFKVIMV